MVAYASRALTKSERRHCVTCRELLAVMFVLQQFWPYLLGRLFILCSDHGSLIWLCNFREPEGQLARWLEKLEEYNFTVHHRSGQKHADALSRLPCRQCGRDGLDCNGIMAILEMEEKDHVIGGYSAQDTQNPAG